MASHDQGQWLPLLEYALRTGLSLSTLRRYIKSQRVEYQLIDGRYLVYMDPEQPVAARTYRKKNAPSAPNVSLMDRQELEAKIFCLDQELKKAREEISELQMLVELYEKNASSGEMAELL